MKYLLIIVLFVSNTLFAQEQLSPVLKRYVLNDKVQLGWQRASATTLPFYDDFSGLGQVPNTQKWINRQVYINSNYPKNMITYGVATFDGLDQFGNPYDNTTPNTYGPADSLTSVAIDLSNVSPSDSVVLSFYVQAGGIGNPPELNDSLYLQFFDKNGNWINVWKKNGGNTDTSFFRYALAIIDTNYFHSNFRMRFANFGSLSGAFDLWHIDYVYLNENRSVNDTIFTDLAINAVPSFPLLNYKTLPYGHYLGNEAVLTNGLLEVNFKNLGNQPRNAALSWRAVNAFNNNLLNSSGLPLNFNVNPFSSTNFVLNNTPLTFASTNDSMVVHFRSIATTNPDLLPENDVFTHVIRFENSYGYDDGSAESGYGLNVLGSKIAMKFNLLKPDTLRAVQMYFTQYSDFVGNELFNLMVWKQIPEPGSGGVENYLGSQRFLKPTYTDSINGYHIFELDTPIFISDSVYIGWQQATSKILNLGFDLNTENNNKMFYSLGGSSWNNVSVARGTWMIRPVVGRRLNLVNTLNLNTEAISLYPNPVQDQLFLKANIDFWNSNYTYSIINYLGQMIVTGKISTNNINVSNIKSGVYILKIVDNISKKQLLHKFVKQ